MSSVSPLHGAVLGGAAVVASPALWLTLVEGTLPLTDALMRYLLSVLICWVALNAVAPLAFPSREALRARERAEAAARAEEQSTGQPGPDGDSLAA